MKNTLKVLLGTARAKLGLVHDLNITVTETPHLKRVEVRRGLFSHTSNTTFKPSPKIL